MMPGAGTFAIGPHSSYIIKAINAKGCRKKIGIDISNLNSQLGIVISSTSTGKSLGPKTPEMVVKSQCLRLTDFKIAIIMSAAKQGGQHHSSFCNKIGVEGKAASSLRHIIAITIHSSQRSCISLDLNPSCCKNRIISAIQHQIGFRASEILGFELLRIDIGIIIPVY